VIEDRARGAMLYSLAGLILLAGGVWFVRAAPDDEDDRIRSWRATAEELVPDVAAQAMADTVVLPGGASTARTTPVDGGSYTLTMICAGTGSVRVRLSTGGNDSGRAVSCTDAPTPQRLTVALADEFFMMMSSEPDGRGSAVFRWRLERDRGF
jgi:hypothetical protein